MLARLRRRSFDPSAASGYIPAANRGKVLVHRGPGLATSDLSGGNMSIRSFKRAHTRRLERETRRATLLARRGRLLAAGTLAATALMTANAQAQTWTVTTTGDDASPGVTCPTPDTCATLRDAVYSATHDNSPPVKVVFDSSLSGQTIDLANGALPIDNNYGNGMTIDGTSLASPL